MAAFELKNSGVKVIDLAVKYGYESPEAFSRAFKNLHGALFDSHEDGFFYMICDFAPASGAPAEFQHLSVPALTWAVFPMDESGGHVGEQVRNTWKRLYTEWFPLPAMNMPTGRNSRCITTKASAYAN